jgi:hypothetical protein
MNSNNDIGNKVSDIPSLESIEKKVDEKLQVLEERKKKTADDQKTKVTTVQKIKPYFWKIIWYLFIIFCVLYTVSSITSSLSVEYREIIRQNLFTFFFPNGKME